MKRIYPLQQYCVWPIRMQFKDKAGYTLWGDGKQQNHEDLLLTINSKLALFDTLEYLHDYILEDTSSNFIVLPGYQALQQQLIITPNLIITYSPVAQFDFQNIINKLYKRPINLTKLEKHRVLLCMNMFWDAAITLNDQWVLDQCKRDIWPVGVFMDNLTWGADEKLRIFNKKDIKAIRYFYQETINRFENNCDVYKRA